MARTKKQEPNQETKPEKQEVVVTRAERKDATKSLIKEVLAIQPLKHNDLLDEVAKLYSLRYGTDADNPNDVKGRVGSVLDIMKKESEVANEGGMYALKSRLPVPAPTPTPEEAPAETPAKKTTKRAVKKTEKAEETTEPKTEEKPVKKTVKKTAKKGEEKAEPLPPAPIQPIAPVAPTSPETAPEPLPEKTEKPKRATRKKAEQKTEEAPAEKPVKKTVKKTAKKSVKAEEKPEESSAETPVETKAEEKAKTKVEQIPAPVEEVKTEAKEEPKKEVENPPAVKQKAELAPKNEVMDMSFLFGETKPAKPERKTEEKAEKSLPQTEAIPTPKTEVKTEVVPTPKAEIKAEQPPAQKPKIQPKKPEQEQPQAQPKNQVQSRVLKTVKKAAVKPMTADEKLRDNFLKKLRSLGGDYFEYYSVYLLEKYSRKNGRRLESLKISGGDRDGGIDGEIELTDRLGFRETIYIQSKNWDPERGNERLWVVGETLLQQFIGACACKQAKDGKQHTRGIFITTSNFTPDAKRILETMSDKVVGYDGDDLFEAAKECQFGLIYENGNWKLDEKLLSGTKAFFNM
ncbi:MAG: restriction endonuclease [Clostridia bacterium]|nr:restriction endonuclease [Clostridia bacterium]